MRERTLERSNAVPKLRHAKCQCHHHFVDKVGIIGIICSSSVSGRIQGRDISRTIWREPLSKKSPLRLHPTFAAFSKTWKNAAGQARRRCYVPIFHSTSTFSMDECHQPDVQESRKEQHTLKISNTAFHRTLDVMLKIGYISLTLTPGPEQWRDACATRARLRRLPDKRQCIDNGQSA